MAFSYIYSNQQRELALTNEFNLQNFRNSSLAIIYNRFITKDIYLEKTSMVEIIECSNSYIYGCFSPSYYDIILTLRL
jgi:hypothetical protein